MVKKPPTVAGDIMSHKFDPWVREFPWRRAGQPLQYSCLENPMDRGVWQTTVHGVPKSQARWSDYTGKPLPGEDFSIVSK